MAFKVVLVTPLSFQNNHALGMGHGAPLLSVTNVEFINVQLSPVKGFMEEFRPL